jgi:hypothetical protein
MAPRWLLGTAAKPPVLDWRERLVCSRWRPADRQLPRRNLERGASSDRVLPTWAGLAGDGGGGSHMPEQIGKMARQVRGLAPQRALFLGRSIDGKC